MIILFILLFCLTVNAQWQPLFPYPTFNEILCIEAFSDSNYLIYSKATENSFTSEIFYSSNAGLNWKSIYLDKLNSKDFPFFLNQQLGWVFSYYPERKFWRTTDGGYKWLSYNRSDTSDYPGIYFLNQTTGFITSLGYILKSTDGGEVWNILYSDTIGGFGHEFSVVNENFIVVNGGYFLRKTTDGGKNWTTDTLPLPTGTQVAGVYFNDSLNGFAIPAVQGTFGNIKVLRTTDSGLNWFKILDEDAAYAHYSTTEFYNNTGIIGFGNFEDGSDIFITTDKGNNWIRRLVPLWPSSVSFINDSTFLIAGLKGRMVKTTDYGETFTFLGRQKLDGVQGISFTKKNYGYILSDYNYIEHTEDNGSSFSRIMCPYGFNSNIGAFGDSQIFVSGNLPGKIYRSTNKGADWDTTLLSPQVGFTYQFSFPTEKTGYHSTGNGLFKTTDGGDNWTRISNMAYRGIFFLDSLTGYMAGGNVYKTTDGGLNWIDQGYASAEQIHFLNYEIGATGSSDIYYTHNGGASWHKAFISGGTPEGIYGIRIFNHEGKVIAYASFPNIGLYYSLDSCKTWYPDEYLFPDKVYFIPYNEGTLFAATDQGLLYRRENFDDLITSVNHNVGNQLPSEFNLFHNYPNPFNPSTTIRYSIPGGTTAKVTLSIYDMLGKEIAILVNEEKSAGEYQLEWNASAFSSGVYFYRLTAAEFTSTKKLLLMK